MKTLLVYCHPYQCSFNHAVLAQVMDNLKRQKIVYELLDLYQDGFNPVYSKSELTLYHQGKTLDPLVERYLKALQTADTVIFITPIWWNSIPGMLKGFIDKVMKEGPGRSHVVTRTGVKGLLSNVKHCYVLTTSTSPTWYLRFFCGNAIQKIFINKTLHQLGFHRCKWLNFGGISSSSELKRKRYLTKLKEYSFN